MELTNEKVINAPRPRVYDALHDAQILRQAIPGCQALSKVAADEYQLTVALKVGPIKTTFSGTITLYNEDKPAGYSMRGQGHGSAGSAEGHAHLALAAIDATTTNLAYHITADLEGQVSTLEAAVVDAAARAMAAEFFSRLTLILENDIPVMAALAPRETVADAPEPAGDAREPEMEAAALVETPAAHEAENALAQDDWARRYEKPSDFYPIPLSERVDSVEMAGDDEVPHETVEEVIAEAHYPGTVPEERGEDQADENRADEVVTVGGSRTDDMGVYRDTVPGAHGGFDADPHYGTPNAAAGTDGGAPSTALQSAGSALALERDHSFGQVGRGEPVSEDSIGPLRMVWRVILISLGLLLIYLLLTGGV